jgi:hypothetical protein
MKILLQWENSAYAQNSQLRIPTWICQSRVVTADIPTLGENPKRFHSESKTQEAKDLAPQLWTRRTIRKHRADRLQGLGRLSARVRRTVRGLRRTIWKSIPDYPSAAPSITDCSRWAHRLSAPSWTVWHSSTDPPRTPCNKNPQAKRIKWKARKNKRRTWRTAGWKPPRGPSAGVCGPSAWCADSSPNLTSWRSTPPSTTWSPKSTKGLLPNHRWRWSVWQNHSN